ncbi:MAG: response regulator [Comamonadaceae bacterium]|nr:response regulator [Comamonadaceae bacterium]
MVLKAILVDDSAKIRETLVPALEELAGFVVVATAESAKEALAAMNAYPEWQVMILDMFLKEGSGLEVLNTSRNRETWKKVIVLTNYATGQIRERSIALGADAVFDKSTELDDFFVFCASLSESN